MKKKGFTLIELLAVIVILAIIALIVTPVVSKIIDSAKKSANARSVEGHIKNIEYAVIQAAFSNNMEDLKKYDGVTSDTLFRATATIQEGDDIYCESITLSDGLVTIASGCRKSGWDKEYTYERGVGAYVTGEAKPIVNPEPSTPEPSTPEPSNPEPSNSEPTEPEPVVIPEVSLSDVVYYDPVSTNKCDSTTFDLNAVKENGSTCYRWRVIDVDTSADSVNIQLDHNLVNKSSWGEILDGPTTAMSNLATQTASWSRVSLLNYTYVTPSSRYGTLTCTDGTCIASGKGNTVATNARARMITADEIAAITRTITSGSTYADSWSVSSPSWFFFSRENRVPGTQSSGTGNITLSWLLENTRVDSSYPSGSTVNEYAAANYGYWTMTPYSSYYVIGVDYGGYLYNGDNDGGARGNLGVRPVINISKANLGV